MCMQAGSCICKLKFLIFCSVLETMRGKSFDTIMDDLPQNFQRFQEPMAVPSLITLEHFSKIRAVKLTVATPLKFIIISL